MKMVAGKISIITKLARLEKQGAGDKPYLCTVREQRRIMRQRPSTREDYLRRINIYTLMEIVLSPPPNTTLGLSKIPCHMLNDGN